VGNRNAAGDTIEEGAEKTYKKTNKALYPWMQREVKGLYAQCFQFAFHIAKKAERTLQHELGNPELSHLQFGYLAGKEGLLAGKRLYLDIKRKEMAYHGLNQREYELTKHVSLFQVDQNLGAGHRSHQQNFSTGQACVLECSNHRFHLRGRCQAERSK
jgi:hypothetical protein